MGDTYYIKNIRCAYCKNDNNFEEEAMTYGSLGLPFDHEFGSKFVCENCKKNNRIRMDFVATKSK